MNLLFIIHQYTYFKKSLRLKNNLSQSNKKLGAPKKYRIIKLQLQNYKPVMKNHIIHYFFFYIYKKMNITVMR